MVSRTKSFRTIAGLMGGGFILSVTVAATAVAQTMDGGAGKQPVSESELRAQILERENRILQARVVVLEHRAKSSQDPAATVVRLQAEPPAAQQAEEARRLALGGIMRDFFETASLVDQVLETKSLPQGGYLQNQIRLMRAVRDYLRNEGQIAGVAIRDVDRRLAPRELTEAFVPQNTIYLNAYAMGRLRDGSDFPGFPLALRYLLKSSMLIQEFDIQADPTGAIKEARLFQQQLEADEARARGLAQGSAQGLMAAPPVRVPGLPGTGTPR